MREFLSSKIHKAIVTATDINYIGSITIDHSLMERCDLWPHQKVLVVSNTSGARFETYAIPGKAGEIQLNGACSHLIEKGEEIIIMGFRFLDKPEKPKCILVNEENKFVKEL